MVRFNVEGRWLDTPSDLKLSLDKSNILFGFDDIKCERSTSFDVPATPNNDAIFRFARLPQTDGSGARQRYAAQMQGSGVAKDGYLYVDKVAKGCYRCIFVTGELVGLQRLRDMGKLADYYATDKRAVTWAAQHEVPATGSAVTVPYALVRYRHEAEGASLPSLGVPDIIGKIRAASGVRIVTPEVADYLRIVPPVPLAASTDEVRIEIEGKGDKPYKMMEDAELANEIATDNTLFGVQEVQLLTRVTDTDNPLYIDRWAYSFQVLVARQSLDVTFPANFPADVFLMRYNWADTGRQEKVGDKVRGALDFLGGYSFFKRPQVSDIESYDPDTGLTRTDGPWETEGEPLAGRTVSIESGEKVLLVTPADYCAGYGYKDGRRYLKDDWSLHQPTMVANLTLEASADEAEPGDLVRLKDNLPDVSAVDVLKMLAAVSGKVLMYSDAEGVTFDDLDLDTWPVVNLDGKVTGVDGIGRGFADYAQRNVVRYKSDPIVPEAQRIVAEYRVANVNIEAEKVMQTLPVSEPAAVYSGTGADAYIPNGTDAAKEYFLAAHGGQNLQRVALPTCRGLERILEASTTLTVKVRMSLWEYEALRPKTLLHFHGLRCVWTGAKWSNGLATIEAAKV